MSNEQWVLCLCAVPWPQCVVVQAGLFNVVRCWLQMVTRSRGWPPTPKWRRWWTGWSPSPSIKTLFQRWALRFYCLAVFCFTQSCVAHMCWPHLSHSVPQLLTHEFTLDCLLHVVSRDDLMYCKIRWGVCPHHSSRTNGKKKSKMGERDVMLSVSLDCFTSKKCPTATWCVWLFQGRHVVSDVGLHHGSQEAAEYRQRGHSALRTGDF